MIPGVPSSRRRRAIDRARLVVEVLRSVTTPLLGGSGFSGHDRRRIGKLHRQGYAYETSGSLEGYLRDVTAA